ncbi:MAG: hypothetical protein ACRD8Z_16040 [Nitrososphaeraceae archaeon]
MSTVTTGVAGLKTIKIDDKTHAELQKMGSMGQTFNDVIWMLIQEHKEKQKNIGSKK